MVKVGKGKRVSMPEKKERQQGVVGGPAPFLTKTYEMVEDPSIDDVISWTETGENFVIWKPDEFARDLLPKQFKHNNFSSFVRQLNTYGFRKVVSERWEFSNDNFRKGEQRLLSEIQRRRPTSATIKSPLSISSKEEEHSSTSTNSATSPNHHQQQQQQLILLSEENDKLKNDNKLLVSELSQAKTHCDALLEMLSNYVDVVHLDGKALKKKPLETEERKGGECQGGVKIFGVCLAGGFDEEKQLKRGRCNEDGNDQGLPVKKMMDCSAASKWLEVSTGQAQGQM